MNEIRLGSPLKRTGLFGRSIFHHVETWCWSEGAFYNPM